jgi:PIN domain nuclease of toxin-antitoxin system
VAHAYASLHHYDPFDRQIIVQAIAENLPIVTGDEAFEKYPVKVTL